MATLYDLSANDAATALLTAKVIGLSADVRTAQQLTAESLLRLVSPVYTVAADVERVMIAIAHQMNFQVAQGIDPRFMSSAASSHSKQNNVFRDTYIDPVALSLVDAVALQYAAVSGWAETYTSHRTRSGTG